MSGIVPVQSDYDLKHYAITGCMAAVGISVCLLGKFYLMDYVISCPSHLDGIAIGAGGIVGGVGVLGLMNSIALTCLKKQERKDGVNEITDTDTDEDDDASSSDACCLRLTYKTEEDDNHPSFLTESSPLT